MKPMLALMLMGCLILSCSGGKNEKDAPAITERREPVFEPLTYGTDASLVQDTVNVAELTVRIPAAWEPLTAATLHSMQRSAARDIGQFRHEPAAAYQNEPSCRLLISTIPENPPADEDFVWWVRDLARVYLLSRPGAKVTESWHRIDDFRAFRLYAEDRTMIHVKIVLDSHPPVALDYSVPRSRWDEQKSKVESSIASVKRNAAIG
jgi:hypothetical protein